VSALTPLMGADSIRQPAEPVTSAVGLEGLPRAVAAGGAVVATLVLGETALAPSSVGPVATICVLIIRGARKHTRFSVRRARVPHSINLRAPIIEKLDPIPAII
jgi:hypothetical protein